MAIDQPFVLGSPLRAALGLLLLSGSAVVLLTARSIDWGVAWTAVIPATLLLLPAWSLLQRRVVSWDDGRLTVTDGWLWRRATEVTVGPSALEILPTAGLRAVVLHRNGHSWPLATWLWPGTAERLAAWCDRHHPTGAFPRHAPQLPLGDR